MFEESSPRSHATETTRPRKTTRASHTAFACTWQLVIYHAMHAWSRGELLPVNCKITYKKVKDHAARVPSRYV
jgi:hypothetical protein